MKWLTVSLAAGLVLFLGPPASESQCYRTRCVGTQSCQPYQEGTSGPCCCNVSCEGGSGGATCSCGVSCSKPCAESCPGCPCGDGPAAGFLLSSQVMEPLRAEHPVTALVLQNFRDPKTNRIGSTLGKGFANLSGSGDFAYKAVVAATEATLVVEFAFERVGQGPLPESARVEVDAHGGVLVTPLSPEDSRKVAQRVSAGCSGAEN